MPILPKDDMDGIRTRSHRPQDRDQRRVGDSLTQTPGGVQPPSVPVAGPSGVSPASVAPDLSALMALLQEQARRLEDQLQRDKEEQARRQEEQAHRLEEQLQRDKEEQVRRQEEQMLLIKDLHATFGKDLKVMKEQVHQHENRICEAEVQIAGVKKALGELKAGDGTVASVVAAPSARGFKVPPFDGTSSWSAYKIQFEAVMKANGWTKAQAMTALTLGLTIFEALG